MNLEQITAMARRHLADKDGAIFTKDDIEAFINEGINRFQSIVYFVNEPELTTLDQSPALIPAQYHYMLALFSASRCFGQDEREYKATTFMNEFEVKMEELLQKIESGEIVITDPSTGNEVTADYEEDFVTNVYFVSASDLDDEELPLG